ncbi:endothelial cell-specific chemotaxis regulator-like isoform X2 [Heptranchias perlo]|uniref:endothelial cell-specific chemotaxis regulator-like isoform X2 n=1 Tax=Heptranchias perlo TaxID=212740 RepID=UPI003559A54A
MSSGKSAGGHTQSSPSLTDGMSMEAGSPSSTPENAATTQGGSTVSPSASQTRSEFPSSTSSTANLDNKGIASISTSYSSTEAAVTGPSPPLSDNSRNDTVTNGASLGSSSAAKNLILVLLLIIAIVVLISLIVLRFKCRNYRKKKRETKDGTPDKTVTDKDQVTLISIRSTDTDVGEVSFLSSSVKNDAVGNGTIEEPAQALENP